MRHPFRRRPVVIDALAALPREQREVIKLRLVEGYQVEEVARRLNRSTEAVKALQHRALCRLRVALPDLPTGEPR